MKKNSSIKTPNKMKMLLFEYFPDVYQSQLIDKSFYGISLREYIGLYFNYSVIFLMILKYFISGFGINL